MPPKKNTPVKKPSTKKAVKKKTTLLETSVKPGNKSFTRKELVHKTTGNSFHRKESQKDSPACIVGIGASAGGLEALEGLFTKMPVKSNMAFVIIQHLAPKHKSIMGSLLQKYTGINILQIVDGIKIKPDSMYLNPPDSDVSVMNGSLYLTRPQGTHASRLPIDHFFRSLAEDQKEKAIAIVLSGSGTDGSQGIKAIKGEGGMTMAQDESQAKYDSMPRSAINTGAVDFTLPVEKIPRELVKYIKHPYIEGTNRTLTPKQEHLNALKKIFLLIRSRTGHDFSHYKQNTIHRRIERRMAVHQIDVITNYLRYLQENDTEVDILFKDMLITVTSFFRDPEAFEMLTKKVVPAVLDNKSPDSVLRIWVPGCATGEEAYSLAMLFIEEIEKSDKHLSLQIFATDIDAEAVEYARAGVYPDSIAENVSAKRLKKFFTKVENTYVVKKRVREQVVFALQNLIKDPPFSKIDLVSCRNLLIYLDSALQKQILPLFHYVLNADGFLFLGTSESIGEFADSFAPVNTKWKIYTRKGIALERAEHQPLPFYETPVSVPRDADGKKLSEINIRQLAENLILRDYAPPCVLLNEKHEILYFHGNTDTFLSPPRGEPTFDILKMARNELHYPLSALIRKAFTKKKEVVSKGLTMKDGNSVKIIDLIVRPLPERPNMRLMAMVIFDDRTAGKKSEQKKKKHTVDTDVEPRVTALEQELQSAKEYLQTTIEELETSNEELKSTNEELQSTNEELQSTNEEMETSKEELQSTNEELETVNSELQSKVELLSRSNNDLTNLLASTEIGTIFLDTELRITRFTPSMTRIFNLILSDIGRPISDITSKVQYKDLTRDARAVLDTLVVKEIELQTTEEDWFTMRILPYRTTDNIIDGIVVTFVNITSQKRAQIDLTDARDYSDGIVETVRGPLLILDADLKVISANKAFYRTFKLTEKETVSSLVYDLGNFQWDIPGLRDCLEDILRKGTSCHDIKVEHEFAKIGRKTMYLDARRIMLQGKGTEMILLSIEDVSSK